MQVDHGAREVRAANGVDIARHCREIVQRQAGESLFREEIDQALIATLAVSTKTRQLALDRMRGLLGQEVGEHVHVPRLRVTLWTPGERVITQRDLDAVDQFDPLVRAGHRHLGVAEGRVMVRQGDRRNTRVTSLLRQLRGRVRAVGK